MGVTQKFLFAQKQAILQYSGRAADAKPQISIHVEERSVD
jgi:hypothetical protein